MMQTWRNIETAPKDGQIVLGSFPNMWLPGGDYANPGRTWGVACIRWDGYDDDWGWHTLDSDIYEQPPTHWMPLPEPPIE